MSADIRHDSNCFARATMSLRPIKSLNSSNGVSRSATALVVHPSRMNVSHHLFHGLVHGEQWLDGTRPRTARASWLIERGAGIFLSPTRSGGNSSICFIWVPLASPGRRLPAGIAGLARYLASSASSRSAIVHNVSMIGGGPCSAPYKFHMPMSWSAMIFFATTFEAPLALRSQCSVERISVETAVHDRELDCLRPRSGAAGEARARGSFADSCQSAC